MKPNTKTFIKALVDSGNLFGDIISEKLAKILKLKVKPCEKKAGTAMAGQAVKVIGISETFQLLIENLTHYPPRNFLTPIFVKIATSVHFRVLRNRDRTVF